MKGNNTKMAGIPLTALYKFILLSFFAVAIYTAGVTAAYAVATPMGSVLCMVVGFVYGNLGRALATLAIIVIGVGATLGKTSWGLAITVGVGIAVIFNSQNILTLLTGQPNNC